MRLSSIILYWYNGVSCIDIVNFAVHLPMRIVTVVCERDMVARVKNGRRVFCHRVLTRGSLPNISLNSILCSYDASGRVKINWLG